MRKPFIDLDLGRYGLSLLNLSFSAGLLVAPYEVTQAMAKGTFSRVALAQGSAKGLEIQALSADKKLVGLGNEDTKEFRATGPGACYNEAYRLLTRDEARALCSDDSSMETAGCFSRAIRLLPKESAIRLCQGATDQEAPMECFRSAQRGLPLEQAVALCSQGGTTETIECYEGATKTLSTQQALQLCGGRTTGARERLQCFQMALQRFGVELALDQCDHI